MSAYNSTTFILLLIAQFKLKISSQCLIKGDDIQLMVTNHWNYYEKAHEVGDLKVN